MRYAHIIHYFNSAPWAILPEKLHAILSIIELRSAGLTLTEAEIESKIGPPARAAVTSPNSIAVLPIFGTIANRAGLLRRASGGMSVEDFTVDFKAAVRDPNIAAIVLDIDSPGGSTGGIQELADEIFSARGEKRIIASVNNLAASAAYWIATAAHEIAVTPSGLVGSIGVIGVHMDVSQKAQAEGIAVTLVSAGKFKAEGNEFAPLTAEARGHLQGIVDDRYDAFVRAVARGRTVSQKSVREGFGEGRLVTAKEALSLGMINSIETMDSVLSRTIARAARAQKIAATTSWELGMMGDESVLDMAVLGKTAEQMAAQEQEGFVGQTLIAPKKQWASLEEAKSWAKDHGYRTDKVDDQPNSWRFRQRDSGDFQGLKTICIDPGRDTAPNMDTCKMLMVGGRLNADADATQDVNLDAIEETLLAGMIPRNVSDAIADEGTTWAEPTLKDFTDKSWDQLTDAEKRHIAMHAAWTPTMPPENFTDIKLFHHRPSDGAVVPNGVQNALGSDDPGVEHLRRHINAIQERRQSALANAELDPERVALELMELG